MIDIQARRNIWGQQGFSAGICPHLLLSGTGRLREFSGQEFEKLRNLNVENLRKFRDFSRYFEICIQKKIKTRYCKRAIITRGLYIFYPIFHCSLQRCREVSITENLCTKQGNFSIKSTVYNQARVIMARCISHIVLLSLFCM